ncbi:DNA cytosine methyltransferase [Deinococcus hohokamensis]|uniref:Cytosine-specific methyltransferase n=1 Tax=Deinococcus hohokamensis TaxID=309883 RepID=A0ABV9ID68_9DEIO
MKKFGNKTIAVGDIFCGIGGLSHGFVLEGFDVVFGADNDLTCKYAYEANNDAAFIHSDVRKISSKSLPETFIDSDVKILVGCAPCQPFSNHTLKIKIIDKESDDRWDLLLHFLRIARELRPSIISMENVPQLKKHDIYKRFISNLRDLGYFVSERIVFCPDYGVPQKRSRLVVLASIFGEIDIISPTHSESEYVTVRDAIGSLPEISAGKFDKNDPLHRTNNLSEINLQRIRYSEPGGTWRDWPAELKLNCHVRDSGRGYPAVYGRMSWDDVSPTITTQFYNYGSGRFGHPVQDRALSIREGAILQGFPTNYKFAPENSNYSINHLARHIGNAVPVGLSVAIARSISRHLTKHIEN